MVGTASTSPASTSPASTSPASTSPASTSPASTSPASTSPTASTSRKRRRCDEDEDMAQASSKRVMNETCALAQTHRLDTQFDALLNKQETFAELINLAATKSFYDMVEQ
eukprot:Pgem_evm1s1741